MELNLITPHIEALVFASDKPVSIGELIELVDNALSFMDDKVTAAQVGEALETIREKYEAEAYPFGLTASGGGYQFLTKPAYFKTVALLQSDKYLKRLSTAALETLAIIAYKQPVTKGEMEHIRGVNCDYAVQKLLEKELVTITGRREGSPGQPLEYAASRSFMDYFGMNSLDELPKLNDLFPQDVTEATTVTEAHPVEEDMMGEAELHMAVNENGEVIEIMEDTVQEQDTIKVDDTGEKDAEAPGDENGEVTAIMVNTIPVNDTAGGDDISEQETEVPDDENRGVGEVVENSVQVQDTIEGDDVLEEDAGVPDDENAEGAGNEDHPTQMQDTIEDNDIKEEDPEAPDDETGNETENEDVDELPGDEIENVDRNENMDETSHNETENGEDEENTDTEKKPF